MKQFVILVAVLFVTLEGFSQQERRFIRKGTSEYTNEKFLESEIEYRKALDKNPNSFEAQYNIGTSLYKQKKLNEAMQQFQTLSQNETDKDRLARIYHNMGNIYFAADEIDKSIEAYKKALKNNPADDETRYNLIAAQKKKKQQDQNKQNQPQNQPEQKPEDQKQQEQKPQENQMDKNDAERLLNAIQQDENDLQKEKRKVKAGQKQQIEKNW